MLSLALGPAPALGTWLSDPQASATLAIAVVGGGFAFFRFRFVPRERRRETLEAMQKSYKLSAANRGAVLPVLPPYLELGRDQLRAAVEAAEDRTTPEIVALEAQLDAWPAPVDTAAHEILANEAKFRSLLQAIMDIAAERALLDQRSSIPAGAPPIPPTPLETARAMVPQLNDFAQMVELGLYAQDDVFGQLHRSVAAASKAVEPIVWQGNVQGGRWGMRIPRLMIRAEHFNDARRIHRASDLVWTRDDKRDPEPKTIARTGLYRSDYGRHVPTPRLAGMSRGERFLLGWDSFRTRWTGKYGGRRLRAHSRAENELIGTLRFASERPKPQAPPGPDNEPRHPPLDLGWTLASLKKDMKDYWADDKEKQDEQAGKQGGQAAQTGGLSD